MCTFLHKTIIIALKKKSENSKKLKRNTDLHTSRESPPVSLDIDDLLEPKVSNDPLPLLLREFERLIFVEVAVAGDPRPPADFEERVSCACNLR